MSSVGALHSARRLLSLVASTKTDIDTLLLSFRRLDAANAKYVIELSQQCQWLLLDEGGQLALANSGKQIIEASSPAEQLRFQLRDIVEQTNPAWAKKIADGRNEATRYMPDEIKQAFDEAELLGEWNDTIVDWWDELGLASRSRKNEINLKTGRQAERLSLRFEKFRTKQDPKWTCIESNYVGFDILSVRDANDPAPLRIEVKGSAVKLSEAFFTLSRNEWEVAEESGSYCLHLWLVKTDPINPKQHLRIVHSPQLEAHIAKDRGKGTWSTLRVPFQVFW